MIQFDHFQGGGLRYESRGEELAAVRCNHAVEQLQDRAIMEALYVLGDLASALILALSFPQTDARAVFVLDQEESIHDGFGALPSESLPRMDSSDRITLFNIFFVHLLDGVALGRLERRAILAIILHEEITADVFFFTWLGRGGTFLGRHIAL